jgi:hypothetical protein
MRLVQLSKGIKRVVWGCIWEIKDHCPKKMCFLGLNSGKNLVSWTWKKEIQQSKYNNRESSNESITK